ncbi:MAG: hypothetical protein L6V95_05340 [Candidatus Melainabacteria bacterium]|nr:MAG: hypothetical protein L6V95_05340 [Candidatus Melainabacteria bacterium]
MHKSVTIVKYRSNAYIGENVILGDNVKVCANAYIEHSTIGEGTIISPFASVGTPPQDLGYKTNQQKLLLGKIAK